LFVVKPTHHKFHQKWNRRTSKYKLGFVILAIFFVDKQSLEKIFAS
jgi:hypothetical protein